METKRGNGWRTAAIIAMILCLALATLCVAVLAPKSHGAEKQPIDVEAELKSWSADSAARDM